MKINLVLRFMCGALVVCLLTAAVSAQAGRRDHLSPEEADQVRAAQLLDERTKVFVKVGERRFLALTDPNAASSKEAAKDVEKWGAFPKGTRAELLGDLAGTLDEAIKNIDDIASSNGNDKLVPKAVRALAVACKRWLPVLEALRPKTTEETERNALEEAIEYAQSVLEAEKQLPAAEEKKKGS